MVYLLSIVLKLILIVFLVLLTFLIIALFVPINYRLRGEINDELYYEGNCSWFLGLIKFNLIKDENKPKLQVILFGKAIKVRTKKNKLNKKRNAVPKAKNKFPGWDFIKEAIYYIGDILNIIKPKVFKISGVYGMEDPCATGLINGFLCIVKGIIPPEAIELNAVYDDEILNIGIIVEGNLKLFIIGIRTLKFLLKKENRKIIFKKKPVETF